MYFPYPSSRSRASALALLTIALVAVVCGGGVSAEGASSVPPLPDADCPISILPVRFIPNAGQFEEPVAFAVLRGHTTPDRSYRDFSVTYNTTSGEVTPLYRNILIIHLSDARPMQTDNSAATRIEINPIGTARKNTLRISGTTNLPEGERLGVHIMTTITHPTPSRYDWSHERADMNTTVTWINATTRGFSCMVNASLLRPGEYRLEVFPLSEHYDVEAKQVFDLLPEPSPTPLPKNPVDWEALHLPPLTVNQSMKPVLLTHEIMLVAADEQTKDYEIPYGSIMLFSADGIVRVFDEEGTQTAAFYDSNALRITQVPNNAMVSTEEYVTTITLRGTRILTRIHEAEGR